MQPQRGRQMPRSPTSLRRTVHHEKQSGETNFEDLPSVSVVIGFSAWSGSLSLILCPLLSLSGFSLALTNDAALLLWQNRPFVRRLANTSTWHSRRVSEKKWVLSSDLDEPTSERTWMLKRPRVPSDIRQGERISAYKTNSKLTRRRVLIFLILKRQLSRLNTRSFGRKHATWSWFPRFVHAITMRFAPK